ncbi:MAG: glycosyl hydrolase family 18, partial [Alistipes sp.]
SNNEKVQICDPWNPEVPAGEFGDNCISAHTHKPIAGLDPSKYGCINVPTYNNKAEEITECDYLIDWSMGGYMQSNILVFDDLRSVLQDEYEGRNFNSTPVGLLASDGDMYNYRFNGSLLSEITPGHHGYGKWLKDW